MHTRLRTTLSISVLATSITLLAGAQTPSADEPTVWGSGARPADGQADDGTESNDGALPDADYSLQERLRRGSQPLNAEQAAEIAVANSPKLDQVRAAVSLARAGASRAAVNFYPRLDASGRYGRLHAPTGKLPIPSIIGNPAQAAALAAQVTDPAARTLFLGLIDGLDNLNAIEIKIPVNQSGVRGRLVYPVSDVFFAVIPALNAAKDQAEVQKLSLEASRSDVRLSAYQAYYEYARARSALAVAETAEAQAFEQLATIEALFRSGLGTEADALAARANAAASTETVVNATGGVMLSATSLAILLGLETMDFAVTESLAVAPPLPDGSVVSWTQEAEASRPEIAALQKAAQGQRSSASAQLAEAYPHLGLYGQVDYANPNPNVVPPTPLWKLSYQYGVQLTWSPNDTADGIYAGQQFDAAAAETHASLAQLRRSIRLAVRQAWQSWQTAIASAEAAGAGVQAAREAYAARITQLRAGEAMMADVLAASTALTQARFSHLDAVVAAQLARAQLMHATGRLAKPAQGLKPRTAVRGQ